MRQLCHLLVLVAHMNQLDPLLPTLFHDTDDKKRVWQDMHGFAEDHANAHTLVRRMLRLVRRDRERNGSFATELSGALKTLQNADDQCLKNGADKARSIFVEDMLDWKEVTGIDDIDNKFLDTDDEEEVREAEDLEYERMQALASKMIQRKRPMHARIDEVGQSSDDDSVNEALIDSIR